MKVYNVVTDDEFFEKIIDVKFAAQRIASMFQNDDSITNMDEIDEWLKLVNETMSELDDIRNEGCARFQLREGDSL